MKRIRLIGIMLVIVVLGMAVAYAQDDTPGEINAALDDLSMRLGRLVTVQDLDRYTWNENQYPDASMGCPQPGESYAQVVTNAFDFDLTFEGFVYNYRVASNGSAVILCDILQDTEAAPAPAEPLPPASIPLPDRTGLEVITATSYTDMIELTQIRGSLSGAMAWSPDSVTLAVSSSDVATPGVWLYNMNALDSVPPLLLETPQEVTALAYSIDGTLLVVGMADGTIQFWNPESGEMLSSFQAHETAVRGLSFSPDGLLLTSMGDVNDISVWGIPGVVQN